MTVDVLPMLSQQYATQLQYQTQQQILSQLSREVGDERLWAPVVPVVQRVDYRIGLQQDGGHTFVHATVHRWSSRVARAIRADWDVLFALHGGPIFATSHQPHAGNFAKWRKFVVLMGFSFYAAVSIDGARHSVYRRA